MFLKKAAGSIAQITVEDIAPALRACTAAIDELKPDPDNENVHTDDGLAALKHSLTIHGQQTPVVIDNNGVIKKGHLTAKAAKELGWKVIAVSEYHKDGGRAAQFRIADNRLAQYSHLDPKLTEAAIRKALDDSKPIDFGFSEEEFARLYETFRDVNFDPATEGDQGRLDQKEPIICPKCGHEFEN